MYFLSVVQNDADKSDVDVTRGEVTTVNETFDEEEEKASQSQEEERASQSQANIISKKLMPPPSKIPKLSSKFKKKIKSMHSFKAGGVNSLISGAGERFDNCLIGVKVVNTKHEFKQQVEKPQFEDVAAEKDTFENEKVAAENDVVENEDVAAEKDTFENEKVAAENDVVENEDVAEEKAEVQNEEVALGKAEVENEDVDVGEAEVENEEVPLGKAEVENENIYEEKDAVENEDVPEDHYEDEETENDVIENSDAGGEISLVEEDKADVQANECDNVEKFDETYILEDEKVTNKTYIISDENLENCSTTELGEKIGNLNKTYTVPIERTERDDTDYKSNVREEEHIPSKDASNEQFNMNKTYTVCDEEDIRRCNEKSKGGNDPVLNETYTLMSKQIHESDDGNVEECGNKEAKDDVENDADVEDETDEDVETEELRRIVPMEVTQQRNVTKIHCSVPIKNIVCRTTTNTQIDQEVNSLTRRLVKYNINQYPKGTPNTKLTPKMCGGTFGCEVTKALKESGKPFNKFDAGVYRKRTLELDNINFDSIPLPPPLRCSTPVSVLAGNLDDTYFHVDKEEISGESADEEMDTELSSVNMSHEETTNGKEDEDDMEDIFRPFMKYSDRKRQRENAVEKRRKKMKKLEMEFCEKCRLDTGTTRDFTHKHNNTFCDNWVSCVEVTSEAPPSLYNKSVDLPESLMNVTSVSRRPLNISSIHTTKSKKCLETKPLPDVAFV